MNNILKDLKKTVKNEYSFTIDDETNPYNVEEWIDTGCYALNAILSDGDIFKGIPKGKRIIFAGPASTAKSYFIMYLIKNFLKNQENSYVAVFETEGSTITNMCKTFDIPTDKLIIFPVLTVEDFRTQITKLLDKIIEMKKEDPTINFLVALDSLGMLSTEKEYEDAVSGSDKADMTRAKKIRSIFRLITLKLALTQTTMLIANHVGAAIGSYGGGVTMGGGAGPRFSGDIIVFLSKAKEKEGSEHVGALITCKLDKSRYQPEGNKVKIALIFKKGIFTHSYLLELGQELGLIKKEGLSLVLPDGTKKRRKELIRNAAEYFTKENLQILRDAIYSKYSFNTDDSFDFSDAEEETEDE